MGGFSEYDKYDALGLAELIRKGDVTSSELCEEAISRIESSNQKVNSVVLKMYDQARELSRENLPDSPFAGVPFLIKDLGYAYAGLPLTDGSKALRRHVPDRDSEMVIRFKKAGLVILGKTNTPEFGLMAITEPDLYGPCRNPWNLNHTPGGSSGGASASVAAGYVPISAAGDGGGSIRIPASCCGLFGLKPSRGRTPLGPFKGEGWQGAVQQHVITRTVRDSAAALDFEQGPDTGAPFIIRPPERPYLDEVSIDSGKLKIGFTVKSPLGTPVHPDCIKAVQETARLLEGLGHEVEEADNGVDGKKLASSYLAMYFGEIGAEIQKLEKILHRKVTPADVEPMTFTLGLLGRCYTAGYLVAQLREWHVAARKMGEFFTKYDLYLTPTTASPPAKIGELKPSPGELKLMNAINALRLGWLIKAAGIADKMAEKSLSRTPFTQLANLTGLPAMSVPLYWNDQGLPLGSHFIAPFGEEGLLFRLAAQLEQAQPWFDKRPGI